MGLLHTPRSVQRSAPSWLGRVSAWWKTRSAANRRRMVLGSLLTLALAARDLILFAVVGGLFALSEAIPARRPVAAAS